MAYRNETKGARAIHLTNGGIQLVEPGAVAVVSPSRVRRLAPGLVQCKDPELPDVPDELKAEVSALDHDGDGKKGGSKKGAASTRAKGAARKRSTARKPAKKR